ncbi:hypothetical protein EV424DRAFT_1557164 [Suillus variegatus]|nr:hypothetical protein EV424DRAFT_1557164 [Suillus variegatus]
MTVSMPEGPTHCALIACSNKRGGIDDITPAISLCREALTLCPPGNSLRDTTLNNHLAFTFKPNHMSNEDVEEAITLCQQSLRTSDLHRDTPLKGSQNALFRHVIEPAEQGRGQQWSLASRLRTPVEDLQSENSTLAHNHLKLSKCIHNGAQRSPTQQSISAIIVPTSGGPYHIFLPSIVLVDLTNLKDRFAKAIRHTSILGPKVSQNDPIVLLTVWDKIVLPIVNILQHDLKLTFHSFSNLVMYNCSFHVRSSPRSSHVVNKHISLSRQLMKKHVPPSLVAIGQGGGTRVVRYAIRLLLANYVDG